MKIKFAILVFVVSVFFWGTTYSQTDFLTLTSSQLLKGLNDKAYLDTILARDGFTQINSKPSKALLKSKATTSQYWQYQSAIFIDMLSTTAENYIIVRVHKDFTDLSERLVETFPQRRVKEFSDQIDHIRLNNLTKETAITLSYSNQNENVGVDIWYDEPFYFFQYLTWRDL